MYFLRRYNYVILKKTNYKKHRVAFKAFEDMG